VEKRKAAKGEELGVKAFCSNRERKKNSIRLERLGRKRVGRPEKTLGSPRPVC